MNKFTGMDYLRIDIANAMGMDKESWSDRIAWVLNNEDGLATQIEEASDKYLYAKAVHAYFKAKRHEPTGHYMGLDACASGIQIMSALSGCILGAENTNLINTGIRKDAYTELVVEMNKILKPLGKEISLSSSEDGLDRNDVKYALMTVLYGSKKVPEETFGEGTEELAAFYEAIKSVCPGALDVLNIVENFWQSNNEYHTFSVPDGHVAHIPVEEVVSKKVEIDELLLPSGGHASMMYRTTEIKPAKKGISLCANIIHAIDGMIVREMQRRCNYDSLVTQKVMQVVKDYISIGLGQVKECSNRMICTNEIMKITVHNVHKYSQKELENILEQVNYMLSYNPFELITVHDQFGTSPNNMDYVRKNYLDILTEIGKFDILGQVLSEVSNTTVEIEKDDENLWSKMNGNYALS